MTKTPIVSVIVNIPVEVDKYRPYLRKFFEGMVEKLRVNAHKDTPNAKSVTLMMSKLREEIEEFEEQLALNKFDPNTLIELMDQANFSFLAYVYLRMGGVEHAE